ncbi:carbon-nitrogen hydrolase family protein [Actinocorallia populi]|uniref:carbon-nitrogen hydrolase family protein n=1 Tax=Actinocorallia populi TaxID=2079200 RepID=UPI000D09158B|nr:carbon-nitrogen hydrolase family protein [Actinocorallia populi]
MREPLVIAVAQPPCTALDVEKNAAAHAAAIREAHARVVVFPELSLTGYEFDAPALSPDDPWLAAVVEACAETGALALAGAPVQGEGELLHIALLAVDGTGATIAYRKQWIGGREPERFSPGPAPAVLEVDGWRLGLAVCKDTGVPQHQADTAALGMDVYVASVLDFEKDAHVPAERARRTAVTYGVPVAVSSFAGPTGQGYTRSAGRSGIWSRTGEVLARSGPEPGAFARAVLT